MTGTVVEGPPGRQGVPVQQDVPVQQGPPALPGLPGQQGPPLQEGRPVPADRADPADRPAGAVAAAGHHAPAVPADPHAAARVVLDGALGPHDCARIVRLLEDTSTRAGFVQVDLSAVREIDGAVARAFLRAAWRLEGRGRRLVLLSPQPRVWRVLYWHAAEELVPREHRSRRARRARRTRRTPWQA